MSFFGDPLVNRGLGGGLLSPAGGGMLGLGGFEGLPELIDLTGAVSGFGLPMLTAQGPGVADIRKYSDVSNVGTSRFPNTLWVDVVDKPNGYTLLADVPGVRKEDVHLTLKDRHLTIQCRRYFVQPEEGVFRRHERDYGMFRRTLHLPAHIDVNSITATVENGQLLVFIRKTATQGPKRIEVSQGMGQLSLQEPSGVGVKQQPVTGSEQLGGPGGKISETTLGQQDKGVGGFSQGQQGIGVGQEQQQGLGSQGVGSQGVGLQGIGTQGIGLTPSQETTSQQGAFTRRGQSPLQDQSPAFSVDKDRRSIPISSGSSSTTGTM